MSLLLSRESSSVFETDPKLWEEIARLLENEQLKPKPTLFSLLEQTMKSNELSRQVDVLIDCCKALQAFFHYCEDDLNTTTILEKILDALARFSNNEAVQREALAATFFLMRKDQSPQLLERVQEELSSILKKSSNGLFRLAAISTLRRMSEECSNLSKGSVDKWIKVVAHVRDDDDVDTKTQAAALLVNISQSIGEEDVMITLIPGLIKLRSMCDNITEDKSLQKDSWVLFARCVCTFVSNLANREHPSGHYLRGEEKDLLSLVLKLVEIHKPSKTRKQGKQGKQDKQDKQKQEVQTQGLLAVGGLLNFSVSSRDQDICTLRRNEGANVVKLVQRVPMECERFSQALEKLLCDYDGTSPMPDTAWDSLAKKLTKQIGMKVLRNIPLKKKEGLSIRQTRCTLLHFFLSTDVSDIQPDQEDANHIVEALQTFLQEHPNDQVLCLQACCILSTEAMFDWSQTTTLWDSLLRQKGSPSLQSARGMLLASVCDWEYAAIDDYICKFCKTLELDQNMAMLHKLELKNLNCDQKKGIMDLLYDLIHQSPPKHLLEDGILLLAEFFHSHESREIGIGLRSHWKLLQEAISSHGMSASIRLKAVIKTSNVYHRATITQSWQKPAFLVKGTLHSEITNQLLDSIVNLFNDRQKSWAIQMVFDEPESEGLDSICKQLYQSNVEVFPLTVVDCICSCFHQEPHNKHSSYAWGILSSLVSAQNLMDEKRPWPWVLYYSVSVEALGFLTQFSEIILSGSPAEAQAKLISFVKKLSKLPSYCLEIFKKASMIPFWPKAIKAISKTWCWMLENEQGWDIPEEIMEVFLESNKTTEIVSLQSYVEEVTQIYENQLEKHSSPDWTCLCRIMYGGDDDEEEEERQQTLGEEWCGLDDEGLQELQELMSYQRHREMAKKGHGVDYGNIERDKHNKADKCTPLSTKNRTEKSKSQTNQRTMDILKGMEEPTLLCGKKTNTDKLASPSQKMAPPTLELIRIATTTTTTTTASTSKPLRSKSARVDTGSITKRKVERAESARSMHILKEDILGQHRNSATPTHDEENSNQEKIPGNAKRRRLNAKPSTSSPATSYLD